MRAFIVVAAIIGFVIGYNFYLHVWKQDLAASVVVAVASFAAFLGWFSRVSRTRI